jgi:hypothetical protein
MLTDQQRDERDPVALQRELLEIDRQMDELRPVLIEANGRYQAAKAEVEVHKLRLKLLKERRSALQSVLKSTVVI